MGILKQTFQVKANTVGFKFVKNQLEKKLEAGIYKFWSWEEAEVIALPTTSRMLNVTNQEALTKDNIAFRFSFFALYKIVDGEKFLSKFELGRRSEIILNEAVQYVWMTCQIHIKNIISVFDSEELNNNRSGLKDLNLEEINKQFAEYGIVVEEMNIRDLTFPKSVQDLFAKHLEAKIRAKSDLENARTAVATVRTLKNASELMKGDENMRFFQMMETISKIAEKGKHTFMIGDINQMTKK